MILIINNIFLHLTTTTTKQSTVLCLPLPPPIQTFIMSPIIARAAIRNAAFTGRRQFSVVNSLRSFARSFEPHVFQRLPMTSQSQAPDYGRLFKRSGKTIAMYV